MDVPNEIFRFCSKSEMPLNQGFSPRPKSRLNSWGLSVFFAMLAFTSAFVFSWRWRARIRFAPVTLPTVTHAFSAHPELLPFDHHTQDLWEGLNLQEWWDTQWRDSSGGTTHRGFHMFHMIHCLGAIRGEFTKLATDKERRFAYNGKDTSSAIWRYHLAHCFDFVRQVSSVFKYMSVFNPCANVGHQDILCFADPALEPLENDYGEPRAFEAAHECRDWRVLMEHVGQAQSKYTELR